MKAINLLPTDLLAVVVPLEAENIVIPNQLTTNIFYEVKGYLGIDIIKVPLGMYKILGTCTKDHIDFDVEPYQHWRDTNNTPEQSFRSLLTANGIDLELTPKVLILKKLK